MFETVPMHAGPSSSTASGPAREEDLKTLQQMFPDLDRGVIRDVYASCDQDVQRSSLTLLNLSSEEDDLNHDDLLGDPYHTAGGLDGYQLGSTSLADWAATLEALAWQNTETLTWQDTVRAVTGTLSTISANVVQGVNTLANSLQHFVSEISGQACQTIAPPPSGSGRDSYASTSYGTSDDSSGHHSPFALGSNRVTQRHTIAMDGELLATSSGQANASHFLTKKDD